MTKPMPSPTPPDSPKRLKTSCGDFRTNGYGCTADGRRGLKASRPSTECCNLYCLMKLSQLASQLKAEHVGEVDISNVASVASAKSGDLVYAADERLLASAMSGKASAIIAGEFAR